MRVEFDLPRDDVEYLNSITEDNLTWEAIIHKNTMWVIIDNFPVPSGYTIRNTSVAISIPQNYPSSQIDMAYFHPFIEREDGKPIKATESRLTLDGKQWQRWSRHRSSINMWRPGVDNISTHVSQVKHWLTREFQ